MDLFIPNIVVQPVEPVNDTVETKTSYSAVSIPKGSEFRKVYFEELMRKCYEEDGNFSAVSNMARIHYEEYYGGGSQPLKRWKVYFTKYNIMVNIEDNNGKLNIKAA